MKIRVEIEVPDKDFPKTKELEAARVLRALAEKVEKDGLPDIRHNVKGWRPGSIAGVMFAPDENN